MLLGETPADEEDEIGFLDALHELRARPDADIADVIRVIGGEERGAAKARRHRQVETLGKAQKGVMGFLRPSRAAEDDERTLGRGEKPLKPRHLGRARNRAHRLDARHISRPSPFR